MELVSDRRYRFAVPPDDVWSALATTDDYRRWWPWLTAFEANGLVAGDEWRCAVRPPLPYTLRFHVVLRDVVRPSLLTADVVGDIAGTARVEVVPSASGCDVRLMSTLAPTNRALSLVATVAAPVVRRGHDWVLDTGAEQFRARAIARPPA